MHQHPTAAQLALVLDVSIGTMAFLVFEYFGRETIDDFTVVLRNGFGALQELFSVFNCFMASLTFLMGRWLEVPLCL
jgi:hypothetical protein